MDKAIVLTVLPFLGLLLLCGVIVLHIRKGKSLNLRVRGFGVELNLVSSDRKENASMKTDQTNT